MSVLAAQIEAVLFLAASPVASGELQAVLGVSGGEVSSALSELSEHLSGGHGLVLKTVAGGWILETNPHFAEVLSLFRDASRKGRVRLSRAAVETLAVIAYNQPVTRSEVEELRGVRSERVIETLLSHGLVRIAAQEGQRLSSALPDDAAFSGALRARGDCGPVEPGRAGRAGRRSPGGVPGA